MNLQNASGAPMMAAVIVLVAIVVLGGITLSFGGSVQF